MSELYVGRHRRQLLLASALPTSPGDAYVAATPLADYIMTPNPNAFARSNKSPGVNTPNRRFSYNDVEPTPVRSREKFNNEQIIDLMEREQDAIVLKLTREISQLKEENRMLRQAQNPANTQAKRDNADKKIKRKLLAGSSQRPQLMEEIVKENEQLKKEIERLKRERARS